MEIKEAVELLQKSMGETKEDLQKKANAAVEEAKALVKSEQEKFTAEVKELNKSLGEKDATLKQIQEEVKELKAKKGRIGGEIKVSRFAPEAQKKQVILENLATMIEEKKEVFKGIEEGEKMKAMEVKSVAAMSSGNLDDSYQTYLDWRPGMRPTGQTRFRDIFSTIPSGTDSVQFPRHATPTGEGSFGRQATEGTPKSQVDYDFNMITVNLTAMAGYAITSRQSLRNIPFLQTYLPQTMMEDLLDTEDFDFVNKLVAAATGTATTSGITVAAERLIYLIKNSIQAKHNPNVILTDPDVWATVLVTKPSDYSIPGVVAIDPTGNVRILGRPMLPVNWLTGRRVIVGNSEKAKIVESEGLSFRQSDSHASTFIANQVTFLLERTHNLAIFRPEAFITTIVS